MCSPPASSCSPPMRPRPRASCSTRRPTSTRRAWRTSNELVGKYLMCHTAANVWALFDEDVQNYMGTQANQFMSYEHYDNKTRPKKGFGSIFLRTGAAMKPNVGLASARPDLFGPAARRLHEARGARPHPHRPVRRADAARRESRRALQRQGRVRAADRAHHPQLRSGRDRQLGLRARGSLRDRQGGEPEGGLARRRPGHGAPDRRHHHGHRRAATRSPTASGRPTSWRTSTSPAPACSRPKARSIRPTRSWRCRCAAPSTWRRTSATIAS